MGKIHLLRLAAQFNKVNLLPVALQSPRLFFMSLVVSHYIEVVCPLDRPVTEQNPWGKAVSKKVQEGGSLLIANHPSQDGKSVTVIERSTIADTNHPSDSWFKSEIHGGLNGADVEFVDPSENDCECGIVAVHLVKPTGSVRLD